jgi:hypothetical protein
MNALSAVARASQPPDLKPRVVVGRGVDRQHSVAASRHVWRVPAARKRAIDAALFAQPIAEARVVEAAKATQSALVAVAPRKRSVCNSALAVATISRAGNSAKSCRNILPNLGALAKAVSWSKKRKRPDMPAIDDPTQDRCQTSRECSHLVIVN